MCVASILCTVRLLSAQLRRHAGEPQLRKVAYVFAFAGGSIALCLCSEGPRRAAHALPYNQETVTCVLLCKIMQVLRTQVPPALLLNDAAGGWQALALTLDVRNRPVDVMLGTLALQPRAGPVVMAPAAGVDAALLVPAPHGVVTQYPCISVDALEVQPGTVRTQRLRTMGLGDGVHSMALSW